jgi:CDP-diacylglycerol--glycerol-3-phosphate 3-phosphatidyltransferase
MNWANRLTLLRIALSFLLIGWLLLPGFLAKLAASITFGLAALTDLWDGRLARRRGEVTDFGILMDPIADKILVLAAFVSFVQVGLVPAWMVVLMATREFLITGLRLFALGRGCVLPAEAAGKHKTVSQMVAISLILIFLMVREAFKADDSASIWLRWAEGGIWLITLLAVILTLTSGLSFLWKHRKLIVSL